MPETSKSFQPFLLRPSFHSDESAYAQDFIDIQEEDYPHLNQAPEEVERVLLYFDELEVEKNFELIGGDMEETLEEGSEAGETLTLEDSPVEVVQDDDSKKHIEINL